MSESEHVSLREFIERVLDERQIALNVATANMDKRLDLLNELRSGVMQREEYTRAHGDLERRMIIMERWQSKIIGIGLTIAAVEGIFCILIGAVIAHYWK